MKRNNSITVHPIPSLNPQDKVEWYRKQPPGNYTRRRVGAAVAGLALLTAGGIAGTNIAERIDSSATPVCSGSEAHLVQPGETVWDIAGSVEGIYNVDKRPVVDRIIKSNGISGALHPGETLQIPENCG